METRCEKTISRADVIYFITDNILICKKKIYNIKKEEKKKGKINAIKLLKGLDGSELAHSHSSNVSPPKIRVQKQNDKQTQKIISMETASRQWL